MNKIKLAMFGYKGGTGKSTFAGNMGAAFARGGYRTVVIDMDGQANSSAMMGAEPSTAFSRWMLQDAPLNTVLQRVRPEFHGHGELYVIPTNEDQYKVEKWATAPAMLREKLDELAEIFDVIIGDSAPARNDLTAAIQLDFDWMIWPTILEAMPVMSLKTTYKLWLELVEKVAGGQPVARPVFVAPNLYKTGEGDARDYLANVRGYFEHAHIPVLDPMRDLGVWSKAADWQQSIYTFFPTDNYHARRMVRPARAEFTERVAEFCHQIGWSENQIDTLLTGINQEVAHVPA
jgi:cellulose biosynthesis protein BcsQ